MRTNGLVLHVVLLVVASAAAACSSSSNDSPCDHVCDCVAGAHGDRNQCMQQCNRGVATSQTPKSDCEDALKSLGYGQCQNTCSAFSSSGGGTATLSDFCEKCAGCFDTPGFSEGFCTPFVTGSGGFDVAACSTRGDWAQLKQPNLDLGQLHAMGCLDFDHAE